MDHPKFNVSNQNERVHKCIGDKASEYKAKKNNLCFRFPDSPPDPKNSGPTLNFFFFF